MQGVMHTLICTLLYFPIFILLLQQLSSFSKESSGCKGILNALKSPFYYEENLNDSKQFT